jgi:hypothetical protein
VFVWDDDATSLFLLATSFGWTFDLEGRALWSYAILLATLSRKIYEIFEGLYLPKGLTWKKYGYRIYNIWRIILLFGCYEEDWSKSTMYVEAWHLKKHKQVNLSKLCFEKYMTNKMYKQVPNFKATLDIYFLFYFKD